MCNTGVFQGGGWVKGPDRDPMDGETWISLAWGRGEAHELGDENPGFRLWSVLLLRLLLARSPPRQAQA